MQVFIVSFLASALVTMLVWQYLVKCGVLDVPNARSSHSVPTPRGGGVGIVLVFLLAVYWLARRGTLTSSLGWALVGGGLALAIVGLLDDHFRVSARLRLFIHFTVAGWALWCLDGMAPLHLGWIIWDLGGVGHVLGLVGLVWMINLYNFMDGIDGLAGMEALCVSGSSAMFLVWSGLGGLAEATLVLAGASAGFLVWNWPPGRIFMGDVGSGFLGLGFGVLAISSAKDRPWLLWPWLILLSVFIVDSVVTLARRWISGARLYEAHCSHAYQHAARRCRSHERVALTIAAVNVAWLLPLAWGACVWPTIGPAFTIAAWAPLVCLALHYGAGRDPLAGEHAGGKGETPVGV